ncbi:cryptochrome/photolyase family protein [Vibrio renipiscarius]|uniref:Deoxyribodipyrimidine photolyase n=1 Tax=Vibrio renipiscarius TaxID=1461322 RepID=A0A0C2NJS6_9VIBR|nr:cryptochrome/photolyase family protein [Vibrio renipiscarius]KII76600.1 deoxyribodipyrimidine photolyase [Vibrio renipiscarius]KII77879.1 deoxyribodipyrimidine photolyase [Vibrio renipiscarius]
MHYTRVRLILGDQLNAQHSWFSRVDDTTLYVIAELHQEATYTPHHIQKVCAFFLAMKAFAHERQEEGHHVLYLTLDDTQHFTDLPALIAHYVTEVNARIFEYQRPDEYRLLAQLANLTLPPVQQSETCDDAQACQTDQTRTQVVTNCVDSEHFMLPFAEIEQQFPAKKHIMMEHFYRRMRKRFNILIQEGKPEGGQWNFDANNRIKLKPKDIEQLPQPLLFGSETHEVIQRLEQHNIKTIGTIGEQLIWPINRSQSLGLLAHFCQVCLPLFGRFQDAMTENHDAKWSLYHCRLSFSLNSKLLTPAEVIEAALAAYRQRSDIDIAQVEGFVRQVLGWREYIRAVYWANMPNYQTLNALEAHNTLPHYFWDGETKMSCLHHAISQSLDYSYAHHIQRLMVTGNFCLITEIDPDQVDEWYLSVYVDAIEWVEMPNTRGMALFADGGIVGTKPYAASGAYINKMSDYCKGCHYDVKQRSGEGACPLNSLYWRFMHKHRERLANNPRIGMIYRSWDRTDPQVQDAILDTAEHYINNLETL